MTMCCTVKPAWLTRITFEPKPKWLDYVGGLALQCVYTHNAYSKLYGYFELLYHMKLISQILPFCCSMLTKEVYSSSCNACHRLLRTQVAQKFVLNYKRCGFLFGRHEVYVILADDGEWPLYALDRNALGKLILY